MTQVTTGAACVLQHFGPVIRTLIGEKTQPSVSILTLEQLETKCQAAQNRLLPQILEKLN